MEGLSRASTISTAPSTSTSFSKARYDEARKTIGKRESLANIAGRFGGLNVGNSAANATAAPSVPSKATTSSGGGPAVPSKVDLSSPPAVPSGPRKMDLTGGSVSKVLGKEDRPTPSLPPRKPVPKDWLEPSPPPNDTTTYKSPARYGGSKPNSPAVERREEEAVPTAAAAADLEIPQPDEDVQDDDAESSSSEGPEDLDSHPAAEARKRWTLRQQEQRPNGEQLSSENYDTERPSVPVSLGDRPGKIKAPEWLKRSESDDVKIEAPLTATAESRAPAWDSDSPQETQVPSRVKSPEKLVDISSEDLAPHDDDFAPPSRSPQPINFLEEEEQEEAKQDETKALPTIRTSTTDSASKGLPSRQRREMGKVYADAGTSPASFSSVSSSNSAAEEPSSTATDSTTSQQAQGPPRYAPGTAQSMASRWETIGGNATTTTKPTASPATSSTATKPTAPPSTTPAATTRPRPPVIPTKPFSLKPWEREAAERLEVEKHGGHVRSSTPPSSGTSSSSDQQQRYQSVASLIDKWQASSKGARPGSGWGEIGSGNRLPGRDV